MICYISYKRGPFYGNLSFGISNADDPRVAMEVEALKRNMGEIISISIF